MLNAFRHHRGRHAGSAGAVSDSGMCSTPFGITEVGTRLIRNRRRGRGCAQRLSASQRSAPSRLTLPRDKSHVLNAFRHHRGRHGPHRHQDRSSRSVLNAFRHHRGRHLPEGDSNLSGAMCSTPFGITEVGTSRPQGFVIVLSSAQRLSASQRSAQRRSTQTTPGRPMCSTPFGITEVGTRSKSRRWRR